MQQNPAIDQLVPLLYEQLRAMAHHRLRATTADNSLNTTGLVHEAYLRLADGRDHAFTNPDHFLAVASRVMRNVLVDHARANGAHKRGGSTLLLPVDDLRAAAPVDLDSVLDLDDALRKLELVDPRQSEMVECRYFGGLTLEETAAALDLSLATIKRELRLARAYLAAELTNRSVRQDAK